MESNITSLESLVYEVRGQRVMLDSDLAKLYGVETKHLKRQVQRNIERFPSDFMFPLTIQELTNLRYQIGTSSLQHGGSITCSQKMGWLCFQAFSIPQPL